MADIVLHVTVCVNECVCLCNAWVHEYIYCLINTSVSESYVCDDGIAVKGMYKFEPRL